MALEMIKKYLYSSVKTPYFLAVGDGQYNTVKDQLSELGFDFISMSSYCSGEDKMPNIDGMIEHLKTIGENTRYKKHAVLGLGEYLALRGRDEATSVLSQMKDLTIGDAKVVLLLRGITTQIKELQTDPRFDKRRVTVLETATCNLSFTVVTSTLEISASMGMRALLQNLENGTCENVVVNTTANFDKSLFTVHKIANAYDGIRYAFPGVNLPISCGNDAQWNELLKELNQSNGSLTAVLESHGFDGDLETDFYTRLSGTDYRSWLYFVGLKIKADSLSNSYLYFVLEKTNCFDDFKANVLNAIINIPYTEKKFDQFYSERKALVEKFPESDIADFIVNNRKYPDESVYKLTDGTRAEREEIIAWVSQHKEIPEAEIANIYHAFAAYMKNYVFNCGDLSVLLTEYFDSYKRQKVFNDLDPDFLEKVDKLARSRDYNRLPSRNEIIDGLDKADTYLYWLDALGVEYLAYISELVRNRGLSISIKVARSELPTITSINRDFFDTWQGSSKKNDELDNTKHKDTGGYNFEKNELPIHLAQELDIITAVIDKAATELALRHYKRFIIVSDHGASRLAVLRRKEEKYETDTKGKHSGRCCKLFKPYELPFAAEENGYLVLADYGRFKGSRAANVEVHGGASLEEVIVPIIELTLKDGDVTVELVEKVVTGEYRMGTEITLFFNSPLRDVSVVLNGKRYSASQVGRNHFMVSLPDIKHAGDYPADVYSGDNLIGKIQIKAQGKSGKINDAFDDLF